jgi:hypothetical protein
MYNTTNGACVLKLTEGGIEVGGQELGDIDFAQAIDLSMAAGRAADFSGYCIQSFILRGVTRTRHGVCTHLNCSCEEGIWLIPKVVVHLDGSRRMATENNVIRVATERFDVFVNPVKSLLDVQDVEVLGCFRIVTLQFRRVGSSEDAFTRVEVDVDDAVTGEVGSLQLRVAVRSGDHGTAVHVHEDWQVLA